MNTHAVHNRILREVGRAMMTWDGMSDLGKDITDAITACTEVPPVPGAWRSAESLVDLLEVDTAIRTLLADPTHDNAVGVVVSALAAAQAKPIDMVLHCPKCGVQHIDAPELSMYGIDAALYGGDWPGRWTNPPHRSHLCHGCGYIWRPADVCTNGVAAVKTVGKNDSPVASTQAKSTAPGMAAQMLAAEIIAALAADGGSDGYDLEAGLFGPAFSALVRRWAALEFAQAQAVDALSVREGT